MNEQQDLYKDPEAAAEMAANSVLRYLNGLEIADSMGKVNWVRKVVDIVFSKIQESNIHCVAIFLAVSLAWNYILRPRYICYLTDLLIN